MATTSQKLIPTSTPAPANDPNGSDGESLGSLLTSSGSPPLIVAFLAIGLFTVTMLGVFAWRRITQSRRAHLQPTGTNSQKKSPMPSERPILYDVWVDPHVQESTNGTVRWANMTPVAALLTVPPVLVPAPVEGRQDRNIGAVIPSGRVLLRAAGCKLVSAVRRICVAVPPPPPLSLPAVRDEKEVGSPAASESSALDGIAWGDASSVQVSVIIAMPRQGRRLGRGAEEEEGADAGRTSQTALGEFCMGTTEVPWSDCG